MNGRWFGGRRISAERWDGVTSYKVEETEQQREERLGEWERYLAGELDEPSGSKVASGTWLDYYFAWLKSCLNLVFLVLSFPLFFRIRSLRTCTLALVTYEKESVERSNHHWTVQGILHQGPLITRIWYLQMLFICIWLECALSRAVTDSILAKYRALDREISYLQFVLA